MGFSRIQSAQLTGLGAIGVTVETDINRGLYAFQIVGLADKAVEESRERVISAIRNSLGDNLKSENQKVIVSLSPAELRKEGAYFDIAIALGYLSAHGTLAFDPTGKIFVGELGLDGVVRPVRGLLSIAQWAKGHGITELFVPAGNETEASMIEGVTFHLVPTLAALVRHLNGKEPLATAQFAPRDEAAAAAAIDFADVRGQASAKRALTIAAAGGHNVVLHGPPGTGKTMLAKAFHSIMPQLPNDEFLEVATIYSSIGLIDDVAHGAAPIRSPHHSASHVAIVGGGSNIRPGDITLAHRGILYMDEFPEFDRRVIEALREPLEDGHITVARAKGSVRYPARFILLAAMNPCPCGYRGSSVKRCTCTGHELTRYTKKLSGPIMDRIDLWVPVAHIEYEALHQKDVAGESAGIREQVAAVRTLQHARHGKLASAMSSKETEASGRLAPEAKSQLQQYAERLKLSPRAYMRTIKVARTIADLEGSDTIETTHILEALQYRPKLD